MRLFAKLPRLGANGLRKILFRFYDDLLRFKILQFIVIFYLNP
jgi:hypothetical protein